MLGLGDLEEDYAEPSTMAIDYTRDLSRFLKGMSEFLQIPILDSLAFYMALAKWIS